MKKILYIVTRAATSGGVMSIVSKKIKYLSEHNYSITLMSMTKCDTVFYDIPSSIPIISCSDNDDFSVSISDLKRAINFIRQNSFDIIISADAQYVSWLLPFISKSKNILEIHQSYSGLMDYYKRGRFPQLNIFLHKLMHRLVFTKYDRVVVLTNEDRIKWNLSNSQVIPNFHCLDVLKKQNDSFSNVIVCVGRFHFQKGVDLLVKIWQIVSTKHPDWKLYYYGIEPTPEILNKLNELQAPRSLVLKGFEKNISKIYSDAYLNIVSSRCESFSLTTIEAMCFGVPTVSFDITGPKSLIENNVDGILVDNFNIDQAAQCIENLINDPSKRRFFSLNCLKKAVLYNQETIMQNWIGLFNISL